MKKEKYYRIKGEWGVYILSQKEMDIALDRENEGIPSEVLNEVEYVPTANVWNLMDKEFPKGFIKCPSGHKQDADGRCVCTNKDGK